MKKKYSAPEHLHGYYTLVEILSVLAVILLAAGIATYGLAHEPAPLKLKKSSEKIREFLISASRRAVMQNMELHLKAEYDELHKILTIRCADEENARSTKIRGTNIGFGRSRDGDYAELLFFADGTGDCPDIFISLRGHARRIKVSPLTGTVADEEISYDQIP